MVTIGQILSSVGGLGVLVCFILLVVKMFQQGATVPAVVFIVLFFFCGLGLLLGLIYGWIKSKQWNINTLMMVYTMCFVLSVIGGILAPGSFSRFQP